MRSGDVNEHLASRATLDPSFVDSLFDPSLPQPKDWERLYPPRQLAPDALVTRFGPSPTGFVHIGGLYTAMVSRDLAHDSSGVYFLRIEDTDRRREVPGAREQFRRAFAYFGILPDEGPDDLGGDYGPYEQSRRSAIYQSYVRELLLQGAAYPCFCSRDELAAQSARQRAEGVPPGYYGRFARCRWLPPAEVASRVERGEPYTIRFSVPDDVGERVRFRDAIRGELELAANHNDVVILKSSDEVPRLPTYHFAHVVDDHLMRVRLVVRADEWLSSVPVHLQLFEALGFEPVPYAHVAPLMKMEGASRRKLSKRADPEADVDFYIRAGYPARAVVHYLRGLVNPRLADLPFDEAAAEPIRLEEAGVAGPLVDLPKLESVSRNWIATLDSRTTYADLVTWARDNDPELASLLVAEEETAVAALRVERDGAENPRKDLARWGDFRAVYGFFFKSLFASVPPSDERYAPLDAATVRALAHDLADSYEHDLDRDAWFEQIRSLAARHGFAPSVKDYKADPSAFSGSIRDASNVVRVALTGAKRSPDLYEIAQVLGADEVVRRLLSVAHGT